VRLEELFRWKVPTTSSGNKPVSFWLVVQCLNQLHHCMPQLVYVQLKNLRIVWFEKAVKLL
jgi:hypothetical protein